MNISTCEDGRSPSRLRPSSLRAINLLVLLLDQLYSPEMARYQAHRAVPRPVALLKSGALRLAKSSANRLSQPVVARHVERLGRLIRTERDGKLQQGDLLAILIDKHDLRPVDLARSLSCRANHLSEMYWVARTFPVKSRKPEVPYTHYWMAMRTVRKFCSLNLSPASVLAEIAKHGFSQHRDVTRHYADKLRDHENTRAITHSAIENATASGRCHHAPFQTLLSTFAPASIKLIWADPPYSNYRRVADGRYAGGSTTRTTCDNETAAEAIEVTVDLIRDWGPKLREGGALLLWQSAGPLRSAIVSAVDNYGWELESVVIWDKGNLAPGNFEKPYSTQSEWCWVLKHAGDQLINHDNSSRADVIRYKPAFRVSGNGGHDHCFEKPELLCRHFIGKHTFEGELCFEPFGCTGSLCASAATMNRHWVYAESHLMNYALGSRRLAPLVLPVAKSAG